MDIKEYKTDKEVYIKSTGTTDGDSSAGWAVALIVLILAIGFAFVVFSNNEAIKDMRIGQSIDELKQSMNSNTPTPSPSAAPAPTPSPAPGSSSHVDVHMPSAPKSEPAQNKTDTNVNPGTSAPSDNNAPVDTQQ